MFFRKKRNGNRVDFGEIALRVSDYSLKRVSLTGLAESDVSAAGKTAELNGIILSDSVFVKVNH
jgi:hypothetical protein